MKRKICIALFLVVAVYSGVYSQATKFISPANKSISYMGRKGNIDATREGSKWPGYVDAALALLCDKKIVTHYFPYKNTPGHKVIKEQQAMALS